MIIIERSFDLVYEGEFMVYSIIPHINFLTISPISCLVPRINFGLA